MKLWSGVLSPFSAKVRIALAEKKLGYETLVVPWSRKTLWGPKPPLLPAGPEARADCRQLEDEADFAMMQEVVPLIQELFTKTEDTTRDMARVATASEALRRRYDALEKQLTGREYLCGIFSVADIATFMLVGFASTFGVAPSDGHRSLRAWVDRVRARPTVAREFEAMTRAAAAV